MLTSEMEYLHPETYDKSVNNYANLSDPEYSDGDHWIVLQFCFNSTQI